MFDDFVPVDFVVADFALDDFALADLRAAAPPIYSYRGYWLWNGSIFINIFYVLTICKK